MLPNQTQRYGDLLKEFFDGLRNNNLSDVRLDEIRRVFNELADREALYKTLLEPGKKTFIETLHLGVGGIQPDRYISPVFVGEKAYSAVDTVINNNTFTYVTFNNNKYGNCFAFELASDNQKILIHSKAQAFDCILTHGWEANNVGVRRADFEYYDSKDTLLGTALIAINTTGSNTEEAWFTDTRKADLPEKTSYIKCRVKQTSGSNIHLVYFAIDLSLL